MKKHIKPWHIFSVAGVALVAASAVTMAALREVQPRDGLDCRTDLKLNASTAMIVDATDKLTEVHQSRLTRDGEELLRSTPTDGKVIVLAVHPEDAPSVQFARCNPGTTGSELSSSAKRLQKRHAKSFANPLREAIATLAGEEQSKQSPLIEAITTATQRPDFDSTVPDRTLLIASDMLQNTPGVYSHYGKGNWEKGFKASALASGDQANLVGAKVVVDYFTRAGQRKLQGQKHRAFWEKWFRDRGAVSVTFIGEAVAGGVQ